MRVLVLSNEDSTGRIIKSALTPECDVFITVSDQAVVADLPFDVALVDEAVLAGTKSGIWAAHLEQAALVWIELSSKPQADHLVSTFDRHRGRPSDFTSAAPVRVSLSGQEPPTAEDVDALRQVVLRSEHIRNAQRLARLERRTASSRLQLQEVLRDTGGKVIPLELDTADRAAATESWLLKTAGGRRGNPNQNVHPADLPRVRQAVSDFLSGSSQEFDIEFRMLGGSGQWEWVHQRAIVDATHSEGIPQEVFVIQTSHTALRRAASLQERQAQILDQLVTGNDLQKILVSLILTIEEHYAGALATVARLDESAGRLYHLAGPSLPPEFHAALDGLPIGSEGAACGAAVQSKQRVVFTDMLREESCRPYLRLIEQHGLRAVWSQPIIGSQGNVLGTFAIYHRETHAPEPDEVRLIETAANLAGLAMERWGQIDSLLQNEKRFRKLAELARLFPWDYDVENRRFTYLGPQVETILGYSPSELLERDGWTSIIHPDDLPKVVQRADRAERYGESFALEYRVIARDGRVIWLQGLFSLVMQDGRATRLQGFSIDITDRKLAEEALRESEERYRILADYSSDIISRLDAEARFLYVSPACQTLLGYEPAELVGRTAFELVHPDDLSMVLTLWESLADQNHALGTYRIRRTDGNYIWFETRGQKRPASTETGFEVIATSRDVTGQMEYARKLRDREAELAHAERLGTMGQMAAELAHELNQPLQAISNFAEAARHWIEHPTNDLESLRRWTTQISQQARRAAEVVRRILNFVRKGELDRTSFELNACVRELRPLLDVAARSNYAKIDYQLAAEVPEVVADRLLIEQVVVNLFRNALEAMLEQPPERRIVTVRTYRTEDQHVGLSIEDRGPGLVETEVQRLFDPYFTTKPDGTGMGLAICRSTIDAHEGQIRAANNEHGGATFSFRLPLQSSVPAQFLRA